MSSRRAGPGPLDNRPGPSDRPQARARKQRGAAGVSRWALAQRRRAGLRAWGLARGKQRSALCPLTETRSGEPPQCKATLAIRGGPAVVTTSCGQNRSLRRSQRLHGWALPRLAQAELYAMIAYSQGRRYRCEV